MGGGSLGFAGSIASFCMALLSAYCEENQRTTTWFNFSKCVLVQTTMRVTYLGLDLPKFSLFGAVHLTVDDQDVRQTSDVARLHLQCHKKKKKNNEEQVEIKPYVWVADKPEGQPELTVGWYFSQFSHHAWVLCSRQMLFFKISAKSYSFIVFSAESKWNKKLSADALATDGPRHRHSPHTGVQRRRQTHLECSVQGNAWWRAMWARSGPSPCRSDTDCCSPLHIQTVFRWQTQQRNPESWITNTRKTNRRLHVNVRSTFRIYHKMHRHPFLLAADLLLAPL